jgi:hypothetical protein
MRHSRAAGRDWVGCRGTGIAWRGTALLLRSDYEQQQVRILTRKELLQVALNGEVGEAQWVATVALCILHEEHGTKRSCCHDTNFMSAISAQMVVNW